MNDDTIALIARPYQEIVDDILTAVVGGVVNEPIRFDDKEDTYALQQPASDVRGITGTRTPKDATDPVHVAFQKNIDFIFRDNAIVWQQGPGQPDDETTFYVDYLLQNARSPLSDVNIGSVTRTLSEAIGREIATVYQQINQAYLAGFVDTATGKSLDFVVAILGVTRMSAEFAIGLAAFFRDQGVPDGNVTIPSGTVLKTAKGSATFVTTELRTLQRGQVQLDIPIRAGDASKGQAGVVAAGEITALVQPITGIAKVSNLDGTALGAQAETDDELRARAKAVLRGTGKATLAALLQVIAEENTKVVSVWDPSGPPTQTAPPGEVTILVDIEARRFPSLQARVQETRAAGVLATLTAQFIFVKPRLVVVPVSPPTTPAGKKKLVDEAIDAMQSFVDGLNPGAPLSAADFVKAIQTNVTRNGAPEFASVTFKDVIVARTNASQAGPKALVDGLVDAVTATAVSDAAALRAALTGVVATIVSSAPGGQRTPAPELLHKSAPPPASGATTAGGTGVTSTDIAAAEFQVVPPDATWSIALDVVPGDIQLGG